MKRFFLYISLCCLPALLSAQVSDTWVADRGDGTYRNPIIHADYSDPDVVRIGNDYYMTASSFNCLPGLPILHSKDLVNWQLANHAIHQLEPAEVFDIPQHGKGVWAPSFYKHKDELRIYYGDPDFGVFMVKTKDPLARWEAPVPVLPGKGIIDPAVLRDDDGQLYMVTAWAASRAGVNSLLTLYRLNEDGTKVTDSGKHIFDGHDKHPTVEGPKLYKRNGYYYIFAPAGGVATGWQLILRSKNIYGPYEEKIVLAQGNTAVNGPHQGSWVETSSGESWFIHFQDKDVYGRILHLQPVRWVDDWPLMGEKQEGQGPGQPVLSHKKPQTGSIITPAESDEFNGNALGLQWQWQANPKIQWSALLPGSGYLRLFNYRVPGNSVNLWTVPHVLLQKFPAPAFTATTEVKYTVEWDVWQGKKAGLVIMGNDYASLAIAKDAKGYKLEQAVCKEAFNLTREEVVETKRIGGPLAYLRVKVSEPNGVCQFYYSEDNRDFHPIGKPFQAEKELWVGAKVGLFSIADPAYRTGGYADFNWFRVDNNF